MAESGFEAVLGEEARHLYDLLSGEDQALIDAIVRDIEADPYPDGLTRVQPAPPPELVAVYRHPRWWVLYRFAELGHIVIDAIAPPLVPPGENI